MPGKEAIVSATQRAVRFAVKPGLSYLVLAAAILSVKPAYDSIAQSPVVPRTPVVEIANGSLAGVYNGAYKQDLFLGIPYAQPPVAKKRFHPPQSLQDTWTGLKHVDEYGPACVGYVQSPDSLHMSEDCLTLNVVRPRLDTVLGSRDEYLLPVAVWIHGGGFFTGSSSLPSYNLSLLVQTSVEAGQPIIALSINYRLSAFGWLWSDDVQRNQGTAANAGFLDQRMALRWIQENIASFGGDPRRVTIFGESAGAQSVGMHLIAYGGRDEGLFRGAIMQSGSMLQRWPIWVTEPPAYREETYRSLTDATGCTRASSPFQCLVDLPFEQLNRVLNTTDTWMSGTGFGPFIATYDGDIIPDFPSRLVAQGRIVRVPIIYGTNSDEGTVCGRPYVDSDDDFRAVLAECKFSAHVASAFEALYPDLDRVGIPSSFQPVPKTALMPGGKTLGRQWKRVSSFYGDVSQHAPRRALVQAWASHGLPAYSYRFDITPAHMPAHMGSTHAVEIPFVFNNLQGWGFTTHPFGSPGTARRRASVDAAKLMSTMWVSFINTLDPNSHDLNRYPHWLPYATADPGYGENYVFAMKDGKWMFQPHMEADDWRILGINYIQNHAEDLYR